MTWGFYLIVFWFVVCGLCFFGRALILGLPWEGTSASGRTATRGSIARAVTKVNGYNTLEAHLAGRKSDHSLFLCGFLLAWPPGIWSPMAVPDSLPFPRVHVLFP